MRLLLLAALAVLTAAPSMAQVPEGAGSLAVASPDGSLQVRLDVDEAGRLTWAADRNGAPLVTPSPLGVVLDGGRRFDRGLGLVSAETALKDTTWTTVWGEREHVRDHHRELRATYATAQGLTMTVRVRVFDGGLGFRYEWPEGSGLGAFQILDEVTGFHFAAEPHAWWIPAFQRERYEYLFRDTPLGEAGTLQADVNVDVQDPPDPQRPEQAVHTPLTLRFPGEGYAAVHEAALVDYASMALEVTGPRSLKAALVPWSTGVLVYAAAPAVSPWRVLLVGDTPGDLADSDLVLNLNEPSRIADTSWIQPQSYIGIWWAMHLGEATWHSGSRHGATTEQARRYIDFAAQYGFGGVLVEGWNRGWDGDWIGPQADFSFTEPYPDFDLEGVAAYARAQGVDLIGHHETGGDVPEYEAQLEAAFALYERLGIRAVKTGYVSWGRGLPRTGLTPTFGSGPGLAPGDTAYEWHHGQYMVRHHQRVVETAARHGVMVNIHEPIKDTGLRRTWPNLMTREGGRGQEYNAWSRDGGNPPSHLPTLPFTRMLAGPFDYTPGIVEVSLQGRPDNRTNTTLAAQLAASIVIYSPLQMAADLPRHYEAHPEETAFLASIPSDWSDSRTLQGQIGAYVVTARRARGSEAWYLGALAGAEGRRVEVPLDFLEPNRSYVMTLWQDGAGAHAGTSRTDVERREALVGAGDLLTLRLAAGGGAAARFHPASERDLRRHDLSGAPRP